MVRHDVFKHLFGENELILSNANLEALGLTKYECAGKTYYVFCGTYGMFIQLPLKAA